ncbi:MAG: PAS domain S-box protein, partial [Desulfuromonadales bacterium]|nr:PAS domain S-box protein [Desulfuromonadales bacterium]
MLETQALLASIVESSDDAIIGVSLKGFIVSWNTGAQAVYGYSPSEARGRPLAFLALPERSDEIPRILKQILRGERIKHFQTMHLCKNGKVIFVSLSISPIINDFGNIIGAAAIARDITRHIQDEQALREAKEKYRLLFSAETDAILLFDADQQTVVNVNNAASQLYGYSQEEFAQLHLKDLTAASEESPLDIAQSFSENACRIPFAYHQKKDGTIFAAEMSVSTFLWKGRRMLVGIVRDITERQRIQKLSQSLTLAKNIQQHLLPRHSPGIRNLDIHVRTLYCEDIG